MSNENSAHSFTEGSDSGTLKFSNHVKSDERPNAERILLTKIIVASGGNYYDIEEDIQKLTGDPAHAIVLSAMEEYASASNSVTLKENQELKARIEELENEIKVLQQFDER